MVFAQFICLVTDMSATVALFCVKFCTMLHRASPLLGAVLPAIQKNAKF